MNRLRTCLIIFAILMLPFGLGELNAARLFGFAAVIAFIVLTIVGTPRKASK